MKEELVYGINTITGLLENKPELIKEIFCTDTNDNRKQKIVKLAAKNNIAIQKINKSRIDSWLENSNHQGIVAKIKSSGFLSEEEFFAKFNFNPKSLFLILDGIQDPQNFGAILRTANAAGVDAVIITKDNSVKITPVVRKIASGAAEITSIVQVKNLARFMKKIKQEGVWIVGTTLENSQPIYEIDLSASPVALVVGAEGTGIRDLTKQNCDFLAHIPMYGVMESLNVSVATGICLFEISRKKH